MAASKAASNPGRVPANPGRVPGAPGLPDTSGMTEQEKYDFYSKYVEDHGDAQAKADLHSGKRVILGLRVDTPYGGKNDHGKFDDRMVVLWRDSNGVHVVELPANTEPNGYWASRAGEEGKDVNHDGTPEVGRLEEGSYRYYLTTRTPKRFWDVVLKPIGDEPNLYDVNHDGKIDAKDAASPNSVAYDNTDYFHASLPAPLNSGGTGSAGCMTLDAYNYMRFLNALGSPVAQFPVSELFLPPNPQTEFSFVLVNVAPTERVGVASHSALGSR